MRWLGLAVLVVALTACSGGADEDGYRAYVAQYLGSDFDSSAPQTGPQDVAWVRAHPAEVLAAGRSACDWLSTQPPNQPSQTVFDRYVAAHPGPLSASGRSSIAAGAWAYLCTDVRDRHLDPGPED